MAANVRVMMARRPQLSMSKMMKLPQFVNQRSYSLSTEGEEISDKIDKLSDSQYSRIANEYLDTLGDELEALSEDFPVIDCELSQGVMTLALPPHGTYVINKQPPNKQIWLSSPISGPKRYDLIGGKWITLRDNSSLTELLEEEISSGLETEFKFESIEN
ncbi:frataxin homolog, mitochondrial [[Candida] anglica]|uniref:ferroxidase n=1 Tax=[Candida] anglica TaxID=148631 RepID=A0ABP0EDQ5_9ASCO